MSTGGEDREEMGEERLIATPSNCSGSGSNSGNSSSSGGSGNENDNENDNGNENGNDNDNENGRGGTSSGSGSENGNLGEIWFDTMRRMRMRSGERGGSNSTPSSPTNSSGQDQEDQDQQEQEQQDQEQQDQQDQQEQSDESSNSNGPYKKRKIISTNADSTMPTQTPAHTHTAFRSNVSPKRKKHRSKHKNKNKDKQKQHNQNTQHQHQHQHQTQSQQQTQQIDKSSSSNTDTGTSSSTNKRAGYQSDDEGFMYEDSTGSPSANKSDTQTLTQAQTSPPAPAPTPDCRSNNTSAGTEPQTSQQTAQTANDIAQATSNNQNQNSNTDTNTDNEKRQDPALQRLERNAREKQRSGKITDQFNVLKQLLTEAGVVVPKGTKGSILSIAHQYIVNMKAQQNQQHQDNQALHRQVQTISQGSLGLPAAQALQYAAQRNGLPVAISVALPAPNPAPAPPPTAVFDPLNMVQQKDYPVLWDHCPVGIALATLGGTFLDCNQVFRKILECSKEQLRELSIFHLLDSSGGTSPTQQQTNTSRSNLQFAFDQISQMLQSIDPAGSSSNNGRSFSQASKPVVLRGSVQGNGHLGLAISIVHASNSKSNDAQHEVQRHQHYLCVTLVEKPMNPDADTTFVQPAMPGILPPQTMQAMPQTGTAVPATAPPVLGGPNSTYCPSSPAAVTAAAATLTALPTILLNNSRAPMASSSLSGSSGSASAFSISGLLPIAGPPGVMMAPGGYQQYASTAATGDNSNSNGATFNNNNNMATKEQQQEQQEQQQQIFAGVDPSQLYTVG
ncbi:expressed unknown protein [Seminavis robusta]|uniref:BHLH domain-containing protein n=1 Tax=Seminavis robusta TaxID=568900 RepID=A0A9N8DGF8_9STRA|nr:expressed unknown protein [Seminavis robusta]|eukprot:Sro146_g067430.1 n/a (788) ;mRNA; f:5770-8133